MFATTFARTALAAFTLALLVALPRAATAAPAATPSLPPAAVATPTLPPQGVTLPSPIPVPTIGPAGSTAPLQYPAYGTPVTGLDAVPAPGVPARLTLQQAVAIAAARSPALATARADEGIARAQARLAQTGLLPNLAGNASTTRSFSQGGSFVDTGTGTVLRASPSTTNSLGVTLRQLVFDGGRVAESIRAAKANETQFGDLYRRQLQTVSYNVATAYFAALTAERQTEVAVQTVKLNQVQEDLVTAQYRAGAAARTDIATAQLPTAQARVALVRAQGAERSSYAALANAMGLEANVDVKPIDDAPLADEAAQASTVVIPSYAQAIARALAQRPDYDASLQSLKAARASLRAAQLGSFPTLSGSASSSTTSTAAGGGTFRNSSSLGAVLAIPLFDQGVTSANADQARASLANAQASLDATRLNLQLSVQQALIGLVSARAALDQAQAEYAKAVEVLQATQAQYAAGVTTLPLLLSAQVGLTQALTDQVTSVYSVRTAEQTLLYALGAN